MSDPKADLASQI